MFNVINQEDATVASAVAAAREPICQAVELVASALQRGGRLIYVGAGTSGRLGVLDAAECPPTFLSDPSVVQAVIAGGPEALVCSIEGAEDEERDGAAAMIDRGVRSGDVVFGIATGGTTPFVHGAIHYARKQSVQTVFFACVPACQVEDEADISIRVLTGPEVITGSTRMKAGTATKMVLNMVSTMVMTKLGKVYQNLMVDVNTVANVKLVDRGIRIIEMVTGDSREASAAVLESAHGKVKTALAMRKCGLDRESAERSLREAGGLLEQALLSCGGRILGVSEKFSRNGDAQKERKL